MIFTRQDFYSSNSLIKLYALDIWCKITTEGARNLLSSDGTLQDHVDPEEVEDMAEGLVELTNLAVLGEDEIGLEIQLMQTDDEIAPTP